MTKQLWPSIVRILHIDQKDQAVPVGIGFVVGERYIITCTHVVVAALGIPQETTERPSTKVYLDFPLIAAGNRLQASILHWDHDADISVLETVKKFPDRAAPTYISTNENLEEHEFSAYGTPSGDEGGNWIQGVINGLTGDGYFQIESRSGYRPELGFSGGPVWDQNLGSVVGMIVAVDEGRPTARAGRMIHSAILAKTLDKLKIYPVINSKVSPIRHSCFISFSSASGTLAQRIIGDLYDALSNELELQLHDKDVYVDWDRINGQDNASSAQHLCESACMIVVFVPRYLQSPLCMREFYAMEQLEKERLRELGCRLDSENSLIIPVVFRGDNYLPQSMRENRQVYKFDEFLLFDKLDLHPKYARYIQVLAERIAERCRILESGLTIRTRNCQQFMLPSIQDIHPWLKTITGSESLQKPKIAFPLRGGVR